MINVNRGTRGPVKGGDPDIQKFVLSIPELEQITGLDLSVFRNIDTAGDRLPTPGERGQIIVRKEQIPLGN